LLGSKRIPILAAHIELRRNMLSNRTHPGGSHA
jgi:hypothetical protein